MELKQLEYFLTVSNLKSFTRAAEQLYISQPSVTTAIRRLEDELGIILFERNKKQAVLTPEGSLAQRNHIGGTAPVQVRAQIARHRARLQG